MEPTKYVYWSQLFTNYLLSQIGHKNMTLQMIQISLKLGGIWKIKENEIKPYSFGREDHRELRARNLL